MNIRRYVQRLLDRINNSPISIVTLSFCAMILCNLPAIVVMCYADVLGYWWWIIILTYITLLSWCYIAIVRPRQLAYLRYTLGDELFFLIYPGEKKKLARKKARYQRALVAAQEREQRKQEKAMRKREEAFGY